MSQVYHPHVSAREQFRAHRVAVLSALLALLATTAVVLVLAIDGGSTESFSAVGEQPALRSDGGPDESAIAVSVGSQPVAGPDESRIAAAVSGGTTPTSGTSGGPDESTTAAAVSGR